MMSGKALIVCDERHVVHKRPAEPPLVPRLRGLLEAQGLEVTAVATGTNALQALSTEPFRLILIEFGVPDLWQFRARLTLAYAGRPTRPAVILLFPPGDFAYSPRTDLLQPYGIKEEDLYWDATLTRLCHPTEFAVYVKRALKRSQAA